MEEQFAELPLIIETSQEQLANTYATNKITVDTYHSIQISKENSMEKSKSQLIIKEDKSRNDLQLHNRTGAENATFDSQFMSGRDLQRIRNESSLLKEKQFQQLKEDCHLYHNKLQPIMAFRLHLEELPSQPTLTSANEGDCTIDMADDEDDNPGLW